MSLLHWLTEPFHFTYNQRALLICILAGFANGFMSAFVVLRRNALMVGSLSHALLPGIAVAIFIAGKLTYYNALLGAVFASFIIGLGSLLVSRSSRIDQGTAMAILYTAAFSGGIILLRFVPVHVELEHYLFGDLYSANDADLWMIFSISALTLLFFTLFQRPVLLALFDPLVAQTLGVPVRSLNYALLALLILVMLSSLQAVGCILALGMLVSPAAAVYMFSDSPKTLFWGGGLLGAAGCCLALVFAHHLDIPPGAAIVVLLGAMFLLAYVLSPKYGLLGRLARGKRGFKSSPA